MQTPAPVLLDGDLFQTLLVFIPSDAKSCHITLFVVHANTFQSCCLILQEYLLESGSYFASTSTGTSNHSFEVEVNFIISLYHCTEVTVYVNPTAPPFTYKVLYDWYSRLGRPTGTISSPAPERVIRENCFMPTDSL
jgi:hypothetical protein